jgi:hypothetical protein
MLTLFTIVRTIVGLIAWTLILLPQLAWGEPPSVAAAPPQKGAFEAQWSVEGTQERLDFEGLDSYAIFRHTGTVTVQRSNGLIANALSKCIGLRNGKQGVVSRCVWVSSSGDQIFSELQRNATPGNARTGSGKGRIVGGTGRYLGMSGTYELNWVNQWERTPDAIKGTTLSMKGEWVLPATNARAGGS